MTVYSVKTKEIHIRPPGREHLFAVKLPNQLKMHQLLHTHRDLEYQFKVNTTDKIPLKHNRHGPSYPD